jgi:hypothetical protein
MRKLWQFFFFLLLSQLISFCNNNQSKQAAQLADTVETPAAPGIDTASADDDYQDCNYRFFSFVPKSADTTDMRLKLSNGHEVDWQQFQNDELMSSQVRWGTTNLNNDTVTELLVLNYTGGAHCCDEVYVFEKQPGYYVQKAKLFGGFICIDPASNLFTFSFNEALGYFFACYACGFADSTGRFEVIREIELRYDNGRFVVVPYLPDTEKQLFQNLELLAAHKYEHMEEGLMDSGWRKEFAMNIAVWHYNHGKNWTATKALFDKYYEFKDAARVWKELRNTLQEMERENDF